MSNVTKNRQGVTKLLTEIITSFKPALNFPIAKYEANLISVLLFCTISRLILRIALFINI